MYRGRWTAQEGQPEVHYPHVTIAAKCLLVLSFAMTACGGSGRQDGPMIAEGQNRLALEKSPYLLQHANNPVNWYPWGEEAFAAAREQDKPIFLSIGYSTCHWCHVMEHESFENDSIAALMNELFICIKVDREERPDVDQIYMSAVQAMTRGSGGWPLSVWLTSDLKPYFGGTYFPPEDRYGRPGFPAVLTQMADVYRNRRAEVDRVSGNMVEYLQAGPQPGEGVPGDSILQRGYEQNQAGFDRTWGGFGGRPKFPRSMGLSFLMRYYLRSGEDDALHMTTLTLDKMAGGGMFDRLGGGFHRYSTDERWLVPHFEKMLYDNAILARTYLEAYQLTRVERYADVARDIFTYLLRDMQAPGGAFYSAEDADSEGEEGTFYVWSRAEIDELLGEQSDAFCDYYDVTAGGNFEGHSILWTPRPLTEVAAEHQIEGATLARQLADQRARLLEVRSRRIRPHRDEKVLAAWNGLAMGAFATGYQVLGDQAYLDAAQGIAEFLLEEMWDGKTLKARWADGEVRYDAYLDDYAFVAWGLLDLYEAGFEARYLEAAFDILDAAEKHFATADGGYYFAPETNTELLTRSQEIHDGALPSGNSVMALNLLRRAEFSGDLAYRDRALKLFQAYHDQIQANPASYSQMLCALDFAHGRPREIVIAGTRDKVTPFLKALRQEFAPSKVVLLSTPGDDDLARLAPIVRGKTGGDQGAMAYVCRDFTCKQPTSDPQEMLAQMR